MDKIFTFKDRKMEILATDLQGRSNYIYYLDKQAMEKDIDVFTDPYIGKWIVKSNSVDEAVQCCLFTVSLGFALQTKHTKEQKPLCFFYLNALDMERHRNVISVMLSQGLVKRRRDGRLYNLAYKLDAQTLNGQYGPSSVLFHLSDFIDLYTGKGHPWLCR